MSQCFATLARLTAANKVFNIVVHSWPKTIMLYDFDGFVLTHMAGNLRVILYFTYQFAQIIICWDLQPSLVIKGPMQVFYICARIAISCRIIGIMPFLIVHGSRNYTFHQVCIEFDRRDYVKFRS
jgi:hypothetical protein